MKKRLIVEVTEDGQAMLSRLASTGMSLRAGMCVMLATNIIDHGNEGERMIGAVEWEPPPPPKPPDETPAELLQRAIQIIVRDNRY
jgi:hypothetical protein